MGDYFLNTELQILLAETVLKARNSESVLIFFFIKDYKIRMNFLFLNPIPLQQRIHHRIEVLAFEVAVFLEVAFLNEIVFFK